LEGLAELPYSEARIHYPMVRESYLKDGPASRERRGEDRFVRVSWETALDLAHERIAGPKDDTFRVLQNHFISRHARIGSADNIRHDRIPLPIWILNGSRLIRVPTVR